MEYLGLGLAVATIIALGIWIAVYACRKQQKEKARLNKLYPTIVPPATTITGTFNPGVKSGTVTAGLRDVSDFTDGIIAGMLLESLTDSSSSACDFDFDWD